MMVVSQDGLTIVPFENGVWSVNRKCEIIFSSIGVPQSEYRVRLSEYSSMEKAKLAFNSLIQFYDEEDSGYIFRFPKDKDVFALPMF